MLAACLENHKAPEIHTHELIQARKFARLDVTGRLTDRISGDFIYQRRRRRSAATYALSSISRIFAASKTWVTGFCSNDTPASSRP